MMETMAAELTARPGATMAQLAAAAGISRATLHRRFPSRDALVEHLARTAAAAVVEAVAAARPDEGPAVAACERLVAALVPLGARFAFLLRESGELDLLPDVGAARGALDDAVAGLVRRGRADGTFRTDLPEPYLARLVPVAVFTAWEAVQAGELGWSVAADAAVSTLLAGITP
ncbi:TetR family transcriptional regulator [Pseudonocardia sp. TRM90224]|uniref:TetR family transcriptional regulator n=1 Tax=Pseudonocardia sp. TRM90224 TaxID=2812678 RepID=UPI001E43B1BF|nr:TetR family transcriptional regulator [Pseudonocardia sp. TRM90224]